VAQFCRSHSSSGGNGSFSNTSLSGKKYDAGVSHKYLSIYAFRYFLQATSKAGLQIEIACVIKGSELKLWLI
jgi:hypothetical protein